jgi:sugar fermentation stimulation protein A
MRFDFQAEPARFLERPNRYLVRARIGDDVITAHCPDPGRLHELLIPGVTIYVSNVRNAEASARRTSWDLRFVEHPQNGTLVSLDTRLPNALFAEGIALDFFPTLCPALAMEREVPLPPLNPSGPHSRIDFRILAGGRHCWVEVKSATWVEERTARFPDAVTERGRRHVTELAEMARRGERATVVFIVQRPDADRLVTHRATDPAFATAMKVAQAAGVELLAATADLNLHEVRLDRLIPVICD